MENMRIIEICFIAQFKMAAIRLLAGSASFPCFMFAFPLSYMGLVNASLRKPTGLPG